MEGCSAGPGETMGLGRKRAIPTCVYTVSGHAWGVGLGRLGGEFVCGVWHTRGFEVVEGSLGLFASFLSAELEFAHCLLKRSCKEGQRLPSCLQHVCCKTLVTLI